MKNDLPALTGLNELYGGGVPSPFAATRALLDGIAPGHADVIDLTLGEPREQMPAFIAQKITETEHLFAKYPAVRGESLLRQAIADWLARRFNLDRGIDAQHEVIPVNGSREGLVYACLAAVGRKADVGQPAVAMCNPYYAAYAGAALASNAEPIYLYATAETGHLPDLDVLAADADLCTRLAALFICSPANPQGAIATTTYLHQALALARAHDFMLFVDECYSEIYNDDPPPGGLEAGAQTAERFQNLVVFNSLSKRSNLPGLRSGFCAGDASFLKKLIAIRNVIGPQMAGPIQHASAAAWCDEQHVENNRAAYRRKFDVCDRLIMGRFGYRRPDGGFFLWLDVHQFGGSRDATVTLWQQAGVKVLAGAFLAQADARGVNPGDDYIRVALVQDDQLIQEALERLTFVFA